MKMSVKSALKVFWLWLSVGAAVVLLTILSFTIGNPRSIQAAQTASTGCVAGPHGGHISADETWCLVDSPHYLDDSVTVDAGVILTIEPGVEVRGTQELPNWSHTIDVYGTLKALGTSSSQIQFTTYDPGGDGWNGMELLGGGDIQLNQVIIENAWAGILLAGEGGVVSATHTTFQYNSTGLYASASYPSYANNDLVKISTSRFLQNDTAIAGEIGLDLSISDTEFTGHSSSRTMTFEADSLTYLQDCSIHDNDGDGIFLLGWPQQHNISVTLQSNLIYDNGGSGITGAYSKPTLIGNLISDNGGYGVNNSTYASWMEDAPVIDARQQFWGHPSGPLSERLNPYGLGDEVSEGVLIDPWLTTFENEPPTLQVIGPQIGYTFTDLPVQFQMIAEDPDEWSDLYYQIEIAGPVAGVYDQREDPSGWSLPVYSSEETATLRLLEVLPSGSYSWNVSVFDGIERVSTDQSSFKVDIQGIAVSRVVPENIISPPGQTKQLQIFGVGFEAGKSKAWLEQDHGEGEIERLDPQNVQVVAGNQINLQVDFTGLSGSWEVVVEQGGVQKRSRVYVFPYLPMMSFWYDTQGFFIPEVLETQNLHLTNRGTAPGVAVIGLVIPEGVQWRQCAASQSEYLGAVDDRTHLIALRVEAGESVLEPLCMMLPWEEVNAPGEADPEKYSFGDPARVRSWVVAQPLPEGWQVLKDGAGGNLEELVNLAVWGSALQEGWASSQYLDLADTDLAGEYIERLGAYYPELANALVLQQVIEFEFAAMQALDYGLEEFEAEVFATTSTDGASIELQSADTWSFNDWIKRQIGDPWEFTKAFLTGFDDVILSGQSGAFLIAETEGLIEGVTFGLWKPNMGAETYAHINGLDPGAIGIGRGIGNFLSIPIGPGVGDILRVANKGGGAIIRATSKALKPGGDKTLWKAFKLTVSGNANEPYRLGMSVIKEGKDFNILHWGDNPSFGGTHWGFGWTSEAVTDKAGNLIAHAPEIIPYKAGPHIYKYHAYIPYKLAGKMIGEVDIDDLRHWINLYGELPAVMWRTGLGMEDIINPPAPGQDEGACSDGATSVEGSYDPNDIQGFPNRSHIWPTQQLEYLIRFENMAEATLPAATVVVSLPVHANLDWDSIRIKDVSHPESLSIETNEDNRILTWRFTGINLPPNKNPPQGEGWVRFSVAPSLTLTTGQQVIEQAVIQFDNNPLIQTNQVIYTIDLSGPSSDVSIAGVGIAGAPLMVSAADNKGGSGIAAILVSYSGDGQNWYDGPLLTSSAGLESLTDVLQFSAPAGSYTLRAYASDRVGNIGAVSDSLEVDLKGYLFLPLVLEAP